MDSNRFDLVTRRLATGVSRRSLLHGVTIAGTAAIANMTSAIAREATPVAAPEQWLLVINFEGVELAFPADGRSMTITLTGVDGHVMAFTDRPARDYQLTPLTTAGAAINAAASDPLNATLVARPPMARGSLDLVVVLNSATVDPANEQMVLETMVLGGPMLSGVPDLTPGHAATLRGGSLFVDDANLTSDGSSDSCSTEGGSCMLSQTCCEGYQCLPMTSPNFIDWLCYPLPPDS